MNDNLLFEIATLIEAYSDKLQHKLGQSEKEFLQTKIYSFVHASIPKYIKGSRDNNGDLPTMTEEQLRKMREEEMIDLWMYNK